MAWKGVLTIGSTIDIRFSADTENDGSTAVVVRFTVNKNAFGLRDELRHFAGPMDGGTWIR